MERNEFLKMCQKVSVLPDGVMHTKKNVPDDLKVKFDGNYYYPAHLEIKFDENGKAKNIAVLHDLEANCLLCVKLDLVKKFSGG